jgi:hypothetical protein
VHGLVHAVLLNGRLPGVCVHWVVLGNGVRNDRRIDGHKSAVCGFHHAVVQCRPVRVHLRLVFCECMRPVGHSFAVQRPVLGIVHAVLLDGRLSFVHVRKLLRYDVRHERVARGQQPAVHGRNVADLLCRGLPQLRVQWIVLRDDVWNFRLAYGEQSALRRLNHRNVQRGGVSELHVFGRLLGDGVWHFRFALGQQPAVRGIDIGGMRCRLVRVLVRRVLCLRLRHCGHAPAIERSVHRLVVHRVHRARVRLLRLRVVFRNRVWNVGLSHGNQPAVQRQHD